MPTYSFAGGEIAHLYNPQSFDMSAAGPMVDHHGNLWVCAGGNGTVGMTVNCIDQTGTVLQTYSQNTLVGQACSYALAHQAPGASWQETGGSVNFDTGLKTIVVQDGGTSKLLAFFTKYDDEPIYFFFWFVCAVFDLDSAGNLTCSGMTWAPAFGTTGNFVVNTNWIDLAGNKSFADDIVVMCGTGASSDQPVLLKFPSVNAISGQAFAIDQTQYGFTGVGAVSGLGLSTSQNGINAGGTMPAGFCLPAAAGATTVFMYFNKRCMQTTGVAYPASLAASYPNGVMTQFALPSGGYTTTVVPAFPAASSSAILSPNVQTGAFTDGVTHYDSFTDVQQNVDGTAGAGYLDYYAAPAVLENDGAGSLLVGFYQPWFTDSSYSGLGWSIQERLRLMRYTAASGRFTDVAVLQGATAPITDIGTAAGNSPADTLDICGWSAFFDGDDLNIWHLNSASATGSARWVTWLGQIGVAVADAAVVGRVTVHTRIGAR